jgi:hypothetical protein
MGHPDGSPWISCSLAPIRGVIGVALAVVALVGCRDGDKRHVGYTRSEAEQEMRRVHSRPAGPGCPAVVVDKVRCGPVPHFWRCRIEYKGGGSSTDTVASGAPMIAVIC